MRRGPGGALRAALFAAGLLAALPAASDASRLVVRPHPHAEGRPGAGPPASRETELDRRLREGRDEVARRYGPLFRHDVPRRSVLRSRAAVSSLDWRSLLKAAGGPPGVRDTVRIALFRFEFEHDSAGDATTGEGRFDYSAPDEDDVIDPPPHNSAYFEAHMEAMRRYWRAQSSGKVHIEWTIFPPGSEAAYRLDDTQDYLPEGDPSGWTFDSRGCGITRLVRDWVAHVDSADTSVRFADYDSYLFVHAGPDLQGDVNADSPGDIPSFNITFAFPDTVCDVDSIWVHEGGDSLFIDNVWVCPETISQDFFLGACNGTLAHEFGHQLGLPDLYDTFYFFPSVGVWDLMDSGDSQFLDLGLDTQVSGLIPGPISAWSRFFLGFERPLLIQDFLDVDNLLPATLPDYAGTETRPKSLLLPITPREYYLIENRQVEQDGWEFATPGGDTLPSVADADSATGVVFGPARVETTLAGDEIEVQSDEYDFALPGYGALVWHVDERALNKETIEVNSVNIFGFRKGLRVEEADGIPDIGNPNSFLFRGGPYDPFYEGNNDRFDPTSDPDSRSNDGTETGISVTEIGPPAFAMSMKVAAGPRIPGFPVVLKDSLGTRRSLLVGPTVGTTAGGEARLAVVVGDDFLPDSLLADTTGGDGIESRLASRRLGGAAGAQAAAKLPGRLFSDTPSESLLFAGRVFGVPLPPASAPAWSRPLPESLSIPPAVADLDGDGENEVIVLGNSGGVYLFGPDGTPAEGSPADTFGLVADLPGRFLFIPIAAGSGASGAIVAASDSAVHAVVDWASAAEARVLSAAQPSGLASNPIWAGGDPDRVWVVTGDGRLFGWDRAAAQAGGIAPNRSVLSDPIEGLAGGLVFLLWGDLDRDAAGNEWFAVSEQGRAAAGYFPTDATGPARLIPGWPVSLGAEVFTYPSIADLDRDGRAEILIPAEDAQVYVLAWTGSRRTGWPVPLPPRIDGAPIPGETPLVADLDGDGRAEVIVGIRDGRIMAFDAGGRPIDRWPYGPGETFQYTPTLAAIRPSPEADPVLAALVAPYDGFLYATPIGDAAAASTIAWAGIGRDGSHTGGIAAADLEPPVAVGSSLLSAPETFAYPNPVEGRDETTIRFRLGRAGRIRMTFFDLSGEIVEETPGEERPAGDNEYRWDLRGRASGVYLCKIDVDGGTESASTMLKIAVMR